MPQRRRAYDRAGHSARNVERLLELGVRDVGLAPRGKTPWEVDGAVKAMMGVCGQRAVLGLNLTKLARGAAQNRTEGSFW